jgi:hypothetical protein
MYIRVNVYYSFYFSYLRKSEIWSFIIEIIHVRFWEYFSLALQYMLSDHLSHFLHFMSFVWNWFFPYLPTPRSRILLKKLTGSVASQVIPRIFVTRRFLTVFTSARHLSSPSVNTVVPNYIQYHGNAQATYKTIQISYLNLQKCQFLVAINSHELNVKIFCILGKWQSTTVEKFRAEFWPLFINSKLKFVGILKS